VVQSRVAGRLQPAKLAQVFNAGGLERENTSERSSRLTPAVPARNALPCSPATKAGMQCPALCVRAAGALGGADRLSVRREGY